MCAVLNRAVKMWDLHPSAVQGSHLPCCSALIPAHAAAPQPHGSAALEQLWKMEGGGDDVPGEGQADLTPLPTAKCSVGSAVITQNRATVCASSKRQPCWKHIRALLGAVISCRSHLGRCRHRVPLYLAPFHLPHHSSCLLMFVTA